MVIAVELSCRRCAAAPEISHRRDRIDETFRPAVVTTSSACSSNAVTQHTNRLSSSHVGGGSHSCAGADRRRGLVLCAGHAQLPGSCLHRLDRAPGGALCRQLCRDLHLYQVSGQHPDATPRLCCRSEGLSPPTLYGLTASTQYSNPCCLGLALDTLTKACQCSGRRPSTNLLFAVQISPFIRLRGEVVDTLPIRAGLGRSEICRTSGTTCWRATLWRQRLCKAFVSGWRLLFSMERSEAPLGTIPASSSQRFTVCL